METTIMGLCRFRVERELKRKMETTRMGYIGITLRIHSFIPNLLEKESKP